MFRLARALARLARAASRRVGRSGGTTAPGRMLLRLSPGVARGAWRPSSTRARCSSPPPTARPPPRRCSPPCSSAPAGRWCTTAPARTWPGAWPPRCSTPAASAAQLGLFEVDEAWLPAVARDSSTRGCCCSRTCSATSSTATASSSCSPTAGPSWSPSATAAPRFVLNADDPLVADLGPRARAASSTSASRTTRRPCPSMQHAADSKHCRNCGHAYVYEAIYLGHMGRYRCPNCGRERPAPQVVGRRGRRSHGMSGLARRARAPPRATARARASRCPASTTSTTRSAATAAALELGVPLAHGRRGAGGLRRRVRARGDDPGRRPRRCRSCWSRTRPGANEVLRTLTLEDGAARPLDRAQRPDRRRARRLLDLGRRLRAARGPRRGASPARGTRAEEMALRLKYAGIDAELGGRAATWAPRSTPPWRTAPARRSTRCPPTPRCSSCATSCRGAASAPAVVGSERRRRRSGTTWSAASYDADLPLWRELAERARRPGARPRLRAPAASRCDLAARGHEVTALDSDPALRRRARPRAHGSAGCAVDAVAADARALRARRAVRARDRRRCRSCSCSAAPPAARDCLAASRAHLEPGGLLAAALADPFEGVAAEDALPPLPDVLRARRLGLSSQPVAVRAEPRTAWRDRPAAPGRVARRASSPSRAGARSRSTSLAPGELEARGRAPRASRRAERRAGARDRRPRRQHGRDAGAADAEAARLRALPGADEHLRRPRQHRGAARAAASGAGSASSSPRRASASRSTRTPTTSSTWAAARTATRSPVAQRHGRRPSATRCTRPPTAAPWCSPSAAATSCSATRYQLGERGAAGRRPRRPAHGARAGPAADRQLRDRGRPRRRAAA